MDFTIGLAGLGLIGGSFAKALRRRDSDLCILGADRNEETFSAALADGAVSARLDHDSAKRCNILFLALFPDDILAFAREYVPFLQKGAIVVDFCGVKQVICDVLSPLCEAQGCLFVGGHPMAGKEKWGYPSADAALFDGASMILTPQPGAPDAAVLLVREICLMAGFGKVVQTSPQEHDRIIAYTSQLAHIVSGAYMKSPTAELHAGYSAGSYRDLTRVAKLNEDMWTQLFLLNRSNLIDEIDGVIAQLEAYKSALADNDSSRLHALLKEGRERKERLG